MKNKVLSIIIFICGSILSIIIYNGFNIWNIESTILTVLFILTLLLFIGCIVLLNNNSISMQAYMNKKSEIISLKDFKGLNKKKKYYLFLFSISFVISTYLGFKFKSLSNPYYIKKALRKDNLWQKETYIESIKIQESFFGLKNFDFNWEVFLITSLSFIVIVLFIGNTIYYDKISNYIDKIKR